MIAKSKRLCMQCSPSLAALRYSTPDKVYNTATGGGAMIVDKYSTKEKLTQE